MVKNITFRADEVIIRKAREKALKNKTSLNNEFRLWLTNYIGDIGETLIRKSYVHIMKKLEYARLRRKPTRDHLNKR